MDTHESLMADHAFFKGLAVPYLDALSHIATHVSYNHDAYLFHEGEQATHFYLIKEGKIVLETFAPERGVIPIETIAAGEVLGWSWLFPPYRWHFSAHAIEPVQAIALDGVTLRTMSEKDPTFGYEFTRRVAYIIMQRLQATRLQLLNVYRMRAEDQ